MERDAIAKQIIAKQCQYLASWIEPKNVRTVWFSKSLQNWKGAFVIMDGEQRIFDGLYFEATHNGDKNETYIDTYKKIENKTVKDDEL